MKLNFDSKALIAESGNGAAALGGFAAGHQFFNKVVPSNFRTGMKAVMATLVMFALGAYISTQTENKIVKSATLGWNAYSGTKFLNSLTGLTPAVAGVDGMGFALPESMKSVIANLVPNLGDASSETFDTSNLQIFGPNEPLPPAVDASYEILSSSTDLILPDLNNQSAAQAPAMNLNVGSVSVDGLGQVEITV